MQTKQKWALTLTMALGAVSCGGSTDSSDPYMGVVDGTGLESKFQPATCGTSKCYQSVMATAETATFGFYNLGLLAASDKSLLKESTTGRPVLPVSGVKTTTYDFPESCATGKEYDPRTDAYPENVQYPLFDALPLTTSTAPVLPLVKVKSWTGVSQYTCNAIKNAASLTDGRFGGGAGEGESVALRAIIDLTITFKSLSDTSTYAPQPGWFRGLQFVYLDGGAVPTEDVEVGTGDAKKTVQAVKMMDGVWLKSSSSAKPTDANIKMVFQAKPGDANWSPVVRLREFTPAANTTYKSLCYRAPDCPADSVDMSKVTVDSGALFLASAPQ